MPAKESRCLDKFKTVDTTPPELSLPDDYSIHSTRGIALYIRSALKSAWILAQTPGYKDVIPGGPINLQNYWYIAESVPQEGSEGIYALKVIVRDKLLAEYRSSYTAFLATYIFTLIYALGVFLLVFRSTQNSLITKRRHNRGSKFLFND